MPPHPFVPDELRHRPFHQSEARSLGLTPHMLNGPTWRRVLPCVWVHRDHELSDADRIAAARLAMPARAQLSHVSRLQALGLDIGEVHPVRFTVTGDLHIKMKGVFLHRTEVLPPLDDVGVTPAAAFIQYCASARLVDAIMAGDWLLHHRHITASEVAELAKRDHWRPGAHQVRRVLPHLNGASRSPKESEVRALLVFAGLPVPEVNVPLVVDGEQIGIVDLLIRCVMLALEYEGRQHAESTRQFNRDIQRYAGFRRGEVEYLQITSEMVEKPKVMVHRVHARMAELGYDGPPPVFGARWSSLFEPMRPRAVSQPPDQKRPVPQSPIRRGKGD